MTQDEQDRAPTATDSVEDPPPAQGSSPAAGLRARIQGTPLRVRLVAVSVLLVTAGLIAAGTIATTSLHGYLYARIDGQLHSAAGAQRRCSNLDSPNGDGPGRGGPISQYYVRCADSTGAELAVDNNPIPSEESSAPKLPTLTIAQVSSRTRPFTVASVTGGVRWRVLEVPATFTNPVSLVQTTGSIAIATRLDEVERTISRLITLELIVGAIVVVVLVLISYVVVRRALKPLLEVEETAELIAAGDMTLRVAEHNPRTEVGSLSRSFNTMLSRIEDAFREQQQSEEAARSSEGRMRRFIADASHELRTPLTSIRGFAELHRQGAISDQEGVGRAMTRIEGEATRMGVLVDDLLLLARLDQQRPLELKPVDLVELVTESVQAMQAAAPGHPIALMLSPDVAPVITGDNLRLRQVVSNLLTNAVSHTPAGTAVEVSVTTAGSDAVIEVRDHGPGLAPEDAARIFERFYRADVSRTKATGGSGLGLSIVSALTEAHGGRVELETEPGRGANFRVVLPLAENSSNL